MAANNGNGLISVLDFANKYRVDSSVVRGWIKSGHIDYVLVGPRHMKCIREADAVKPIQPQSSLPILPIQVSNIRKAVEKLMADGVDADTAVLVVNGMDDSEVAAMVEGA